ncbi:alginate lyase family protein [Chelativorans salis]|uniref:Heparinase II/III family protein n=1 Tax=Chelativorans salis TaxID=2978478 RepID=A0ABT2LMA5_9HYPH|nr:alginate lyase family protein [Chelativorans sp. EGI FJ00035]MCT7375727.1 heparinase II/III family protein [Chelativorans sp. EGI FJ00035]
MTNIFTLLLALILSSASALANSIGPDDIYLSQVKGDESTYRPRSDVPAWEYSLPIDWAADPFNDPNWQSQLHMWRIMDPLIARYFSGEDGAIEYAARIAVDWHRWHQSNEATYSWHDMPTGIRALKIALFLDLIREGTLSAIYRDDLVELAREHAKRLQVDEFVSSGNHGLFQVFGLNLLCSATDIQECSNGKEFAAEKFRWIFSHQFTEQGVHKENSPAYHQFAMRVIRRLGGPERFADAGIEALLRKADTVEPWLIMPDGRWPSVGDSDGRARTELPERLEGGQRECLPDGGCFAVADFEKSGYAIVRSEDPQGPSMLFVTGMAQSWKHKQADELSFELFEHGRRIFIDSGKYGYAQDAMRDYVRSAAAHNTVALEDDRIGRRSIRLTGSLLAETQIEGGRFVISGEAERLDLFRQNRRIEYSPGERLVIEDRLSSEVPREYVSSLHLAPDLEPAFTEDGFEVDIDGQRVTATLAEHDCKIEAIRGESEPSPLGWATVSYLKMKPATVVRAICPGQDRTIRWDIDL